MGRTNKVVRILGTVGCLNYNGGRDPEWSTLIEADDPEKLDWKDIPDKLEFEGTKLRVVLKDGTRNLHAFTSDELRQNGDELLWTKRNPLAAELQGLRGRRNVLQRQYQEDLQGKSGRLLLTFRKGGPRNELQASDTVQNGRTRRVFVLNWETIERYGIKEGPTYACSIQRVIEQHQPQGNRNGFMLILVSVSHEHFDPDQRIKKLEQRIVAAK